MKLTDILCAPLYLYQSRKLKNHALKLPEAQGVRSGLVELNTQQKPQPSLTEHTLNLMMVGDSSAAGVGVDNQNDALIGQLLTALAKINSHQKLDPNLQRIKPNSTINRLANYTYINWSLHATSGHTSFDALKRLYVLTAPEKAIDVLIFVIGVNDVARDITSEQWRTRLHALIDISQRKFLARHIIFCSLPPMAHMPALSKPLNQYIANKSDAVNTILQSVCHEHDKVDYFNADLKSFTNDMTELFAKDGLHPSAKAYQYWGNELAKYINRLL